MSVQVPAEMPLGRAVRYAVHSDGATCTTNAVQVGTVFNRRPSRLLFACRCLCPGQLEDHSQQLQHPSKLSVPLPLLAAIPASGCVL